MTLDAPPIWLTTPIWSMRTGFELFTGLGDHWRASMLHTSGRNLPGLARPHVGVGIYSALRAVDQS